MTVQGVATPRGGTGGARPRRRDSPGRHCRVHRSSVDVARADPPAVTSYIELYIELAMDSPTHPAPELLHAMARRLCTALALYESGVAMKRARLRREDPAASDAQISARLAAWLRTRPGASIGDTDDSAGTQSRPR